MIRHSCSTVSAVRFCTVFVERKEKCIFGKENLSRQKEERKRSSGEEFGIDCVNRAAMALVQMED
jgi:hypothetical protein